MHRQSNGLEIPTWFAIDADGIVGRFDAGSSGAIPRAALLSDDELIFIEEELDRFHRRSEAWPMPWVQPEATLRDVAEPYVPEPLDPDLAGEDDSFLPLRLADLPAALRKLLGRLRLDAVRFAEVKELQPALLVGCVLPRGGYRALDGTRVMPGA